MNDKPLLDDCELDWVDFANRIDEMCDEFEALWIRGQSPQIEHFLERSGAPLREQLFLELLLIDREYRIRSGEDVTRQDYQLRFPDYATAIGDLEFATIADAPLDSVK